MNSKNNNLPQVNKEEMDIKLSKIEKANTCRVLMFKLLEEMGLPKGNLAMQTFTDKYAEIQKDSLDCQKELQDLYILGLNEKPKNKRKRKTSLEKELEAWEEFPEKTDTFSNGDYK